MAKKKNLSVVAGFCWRYDDPNRQAFKRIHDGQIGDVVAAYTTYNAGVLRETDRQPGWTDMEYQLRNWWYYTWLSGDHIAEQACHSIDKINWAMNNKTPKRAVAIGGRQARNTPNSGHVWDHFGVTFEYDDGSRGFHMCRQLANCANDNSDYILGTEGNCFVNGWGPTQVIKGKRPWRYKKAPRVNMYQQEHNELFASIRKGEPINDGEWMMQSTMMSILGRMAAYTGQTITWEQAMNSKERLGPETYSWGEVAMPEVAIPGRHKFV